MDAFWQDLQLAARSYRQQPGFTAVAVLILALGIGANTAIYSLVDAVALRPLPVAHTSDLYRLGDNLNCCVNTGLQGDFSLFSYPLYQRLRDHIPELSPLAAFQVRPLPFSVRRAGTAAAARPMIGEFVSGNYFDTFGVPMAAGRGLADSDDAPGAAPVAVLSYRAWRDHHAKDPSVVGAAFTVNATPVTVVGVTAPEFFGETLRPDPPDLWVALGAEPTIRGASSLIARPGQHWLYAIGRLTPGASPAVVEQKASALLREFLATVPDLSPANIADLPKQRIVVAEAGTGVSALRSRYAEPLRVLAIVSALVLFIACANLAHLLLARAQPFPFAMRAALGASRGRLIQQMMAGGLLLAVAGGTAGVLVAYACTRTILATVFRGADVVPIDVTPSTAGLMFAAAVSLVTGVIFTALPAWIMSKTNPMDILRGSGRSTADRAALPRQGLVVLQVAVSLVLLVGAGLLTESLRRLERQDFGFQIDGRYVVKIDPSLAGYSPERLGELYDKLHTALPQVPGVVSASMSQYSPMEGLNWSGPISAEGRTPPADRTESASFVRIGPKYFETIGTRLVRGRTIDERDRPGTTLVAVINQTLARQFFPNVDPIGRHLGRGDASRAMDLEIVGVVEDAKYTRADQPAWPTFFIPLLQFVPAGDVSTQMRSMFVRAIELHVAGSPASLDADVRRAIARVDPNLTVTAILSMEEQVGRNFNQQRLVARLTALYGQLALLLAAIGLYGITAHHVSRRIGEIGVRVALGADRGRVLRMVLRSALVQCGAGVAIGLPIALFASRGLATQLYGVTPRDPVVIGAAVAVLLVATIVAALIPARRAAAVDPIRALRAE